MESRSASFTSKFPILHRLASRKHDHQTENTGSIPPTPPNQAPLPMAEASFTTRNNFIAVVGEFVGTFMFLFLAYAGGQTANIPKPVKGALPNTSDLLYVSLCFGFSLVVNVWTFYRVTGGLFNPAVTLALCICRVINPLRGALIFAAQLIGGIAAAGVVSCLFPGGLNIQTRLGGGTSIVQGLFIEMFLTANLVLVVIMLAVVKQKSTFLAPVCIGLVLFMCQMVGTYYTGCSVNPARSLGPDVINRDFPGYHWIYWVGPLLGCLVACGFYGFLRIFHYEAVNPGQDYGEWEAQMGPGSWNGELDRPSYALSSPNTPNRTHFGHRDQGVNGAGASPTGSLRTKENAEEQV